MDVSECARWFKVISQVSGGHRPYINLTISESQSHGQLDVEDSEVMVFS